MKRTWLVVLAMSAVVASSGVAAVEAPKLKPGLWEMRVGSSVGGAATALPQTVCVGAMSDQQRQLEQDNIKNRCSKYDARTLEGKWVVDAVCSARGHTISKHVVTSKGGDNYHEDDASPQGSMTSDGKWLGACKPGQKPDTFK